MEVIYSIYFVRSFQKAPESIQCNFEKQLDHLMCDFRHPSLRTKKYDKAQGIWQARVD